MSNAQMRMRMAMRYGLNLVLIMEIISTWYMMLWCPDIDLVSGQVREVSKMFSPCGVWQEFMLRDGGNFVLADRIGYWTTVTSMKMV